MVRAFDAFGQFSFQSHFFLVLNSKKKSNFSNRIFSISSPAILKAPFIAHGVPIDSDQNDLFDALDDFSLVIILEKLSRRDLMNLGTMNPRISQLIKDFDILPDSSIKKSRLLIKLGVRKTPEAHYFPIIERDVANIMCDSLECILKLLNVYCYAFDRLDFTIDYASGPDSNATQTVVDYIKRYCSTTEQKVRILNAGDSIAELAGLTATSVTIHGPEKPVNFTINAYFPRVKRLTIRIGTEYALNEHLPHLRHFELIDTSCEHFDLRAFGALNPRIRSLELDPCQGLDKLHEVNAIFPNLEEFVLTPRITYSENSSLRRLPRPTDTPIRFQNVKIYTIDLSGGLGDVFHACYFRLFAYIQFEQLESLKYISSLNIYGENRNVDFVGQYKQLRILDCSLFEIFYEEIWRLLGSLPNLKEISIKPRRERPYRDDFLRLMEVTSLETIRVSLDPGAVHQFRNLTLPERWVLEPPPVSQLGLAYFKSLTFSRKLF